MRLLLIVQLLLTGVLYATETPDSALQKLMEGNVRFATDQLLYLDRTKERRQETAGGQEPFAIILGCSDSRVAPEIIFDQGIGDLFVVRVAGNVVGPIELDSIEYSALYLRSALILVLGHENCGAVQAALQGNTNDIEHVIDLILPAVKKTQGQEGDRLMNTVKENVKMIVRELRKTPVLRRLIAQKKLGVQGAYYNFQTGQVELL